MCSVEAMNLDEEPLAFYHIIHAFFRYDQLAGRRLPRFEYSALPRRVYVRNVAVCMFYFDDNRVSAAKGLACMFCGCGGIGRRARFRFWWETVQVQVLSPASKKEER